MPIDAERFGEARQPLDAPGHLPEAAYEALRQVAFDE
jgi:hypothetical protein